MAKKKVLTRRFEPIEIRIESEEIEDLEVSDEDKAISIQKILLQPVGYPIRMIEHPSSQSDMEIEDNDLFQAYAQDQWVGLNISEGEYLFDQMILPDFAFKIIKIEPPETHRISSETEFEIEQTIDSSILQFEKTRFDDIIGNERAIEKCKIIQEFMIHPEKFGKWTPKNVLFYGLPGTGKTLTARALASESESNILIRKGTALIGLHVGDGANKIHTLFDKARKIAKNQGSAIIFIDEIDAIGLSRSYQLVRGDVVEVSTALLSEMDGISENYGVILIGATNNIDLLDPGLRSRFEEEIKFELPNVGERIKMMQLFLNTTGLEYDINFQEISKHLEGWSGRDIKEKLIKIAFHGAILSKSDKITTKQLLKIIKKVSKTENDGNVLFS
jgi:AAA family ATPase